MAANFQRRFLFITKTESNILRLSPLLLGFGFFVRSGQLRHRSLGHFEPQVVRRNPQMDRVLLQSHDGAPKAAAGRDFVAGLDALKHGLPLLLTALLGHNYEKVKYPDYQPQRDPEGEATPSR